MHQHVKFEEGRQTMKRLVATLALALTCIAPSASADPTQFGFLPYKVAIKELPPGYNDFMALREDLRVRQVLHGKILCEQWPQVISFQTRLKEGHTVAGAINYMTRAWKGKQVCKPHTVMATPVQFAVRGGRAEDNIDVFILKWATEDGRLLYNGIDATLLNVN
jgi:hypothetical protein